MFDVNPLGVTMYLKELDRKADRELVRSVEPAKPTARTLAHLRGALAGLAHGLDILATFQRAAKHQE